MIFTLIDCSIPINTRNQKIVDSIKKEYPDAAIHVISWNREGKKHDLSNIYHIYERNAPPADVKAKLMGMRGFKKYIGRVLSEIHPDVIIASHWSNLILVSGFKKKGQMLIYENLDIPTGGLFVRTASCFCEHFALRNVDLIIHASRFFMSLYKQKIPQIILENKPAFPPNREKGGTAHPLKVAFIGAIRYKDILMKLVDALKDDGKYELYFHGSGEDLDAMKDYCKDAKNVFFTGKYAYSEVVGLYHQSDVIWAGYPNKDYNVVYAISNKFHESLYVGVPCVYSSRTKLADCVKRENIGFVVDPYNTYAIKSLFDNISSGKIDLDEVKEAMEEYQKKETTWNEDFNQLIKALYEYKFRE